MVCQISALSSCRQMCWDDVRGEGNAFFIFLFAEVGKGGRGGEERRGQSDFFFALLAGTKKKCNHQAINFLKRY